MDTPNIVTLHSFTVDTIPDLDVVVLAALELFQKETVPQIPLTQYKHPLVIGSGNAEATGRILFEKSDALFASESNYERKLTSIDTLDGVIVISASGGKHAPSIVKRAKECGKKVTLLTTVKHSAASKVLDVASGDVECIFPKNREPYTYNTSSYMGMILSSTQEDPALIASFIREVIDPIDFSIFAQYDKYYLIVPPEFSGIIRMLQVKFIELFGRVIAHDIETSEYVRHATTVVPTKELFISFGYENTSWGEEGSRINIPLHDLAQYGTMMAVGYYVIGKVQKAHQDYFKQNIVNYTKEISKVFGEEILPIVE